MAIFCEPENTSHPFADQIGGPLAPPGTFLATIIDIKDEFGIQRQKYDSPEMEKVDLTCFLFGFRDADGQPHKVASRRMRISGNEKSALFAFLKSILGRPFEYGRDYMELKGTSCLLTVEHVQRRDGSGVFAGIAALSPLPAGFGAEASGADFSRARPEPVTDTGRSRGGRTAHRSRSSRSGRSAGGPDPFLRVKQRWLC